jgi:hypothetical protein
VNLGLHQRLTAGATDSPACTYLGTDKEHDTASENTILVITQDLRDNKYLKCYQIRGIILAKFEG